MSDHHEKRIAELEGELSDIKETYRTVMEEKCASDEVHCACVPALRSKIAELEQEIKNRGTGLALAEARFDKLIGRRDYYIEELEQRIAELVGGEI